jgi:hypothetical protein
MLVRTVLHIDYLNSERCVVKSPVLYVHNVHTFIFLRYDIKIVHILRRSRGSSVSIVSDYGLDDRAIGIQSPAGA